MPAVQRRGICAEKGESEEQRRERGGGLGPRTQQRADSHGPCARKTTADLHGPCAKKSLTMCGPGVYCACKHRALWPTRQSIHIDIHQTRRITLGRTLSLAPLR